MQGRSIPRRHEDVSVTERDKNGKGARPKGDQNVTDPQHVGEVVGPTQVARALGIQRETVSRWMRENKVKTVNEKGRRRIPRKEFDRLREQYGPTRDGLPDPSTAGLPKAVVEHVAEAERRALEATSRAITAESELKQLETRARSNSERDKVVVMLATGSWRERRQARRQAKQLLLDSQAI